MAEFSRSAEGSLFGKCDDEIKVKFPSQKKLELTVMAHEAGYATLSEYVRMILFIHRDGLEKVARLQQERLEKIAKIGNE